MRGITLSKDDPPFSLWLGLFALAAVDVFWVARLGAGVSFAGFSFLPELIVPIWLVCLPKVKNERLRTAAGGLAFLLLAWPLLRLFNHLTMTTAMPMQDVLLAQWDAALGLDWVGYMQFLDKHLRLLVLMSFCYTSLTTVCCAVFGVLVAAGELKQARDFLILFFWSALLISTAGLFFPAEGAMVHYAPGAAVLKVIPLDAGTWFVASLHEVREHPAHLYKLAALPGLTAFPSFHTAMGIFILYCARRRAFLFLCAVPFTSLMIASTPVFGGHYFVDVLAGVGVALGLIGVVHFMGRESAPRLQPMALAAAE